MRREERREKREERRETREWRREKRDESKKDDKLGHGAWAQCFGARLGREA